MLFGFFPEIGIGKPAGEYLPAFFESAHRPIHRLAIVRPEHVEAEHLARPILEEVMDGHEVPEALRHLLSFDLEEAVVHPDVRHHFVAEGRAGLGKLVLVMRKYEIDAAAMDVEDLAQKLPGHCRAFDMPAWPAPAPRALPARRLGIRRLPQHEVHRV